LRCARQFDDKIASLVNQRGYELLIPGLDHLDLLQLRSEGGREGILSDGKPRVGQDQLLKKQVDALWRKAGYPTADVEEMCLDRGREVKERGPAKGLDAESIVLADLG
jgi:hypothetical protein